MAKGLRIIEALYPTVDDGDPIRGMFSGEQATINLREVSFECVVLSSSNIVSWDGIHWYRADIG